MAEWLGGLSRPSIVRWTDPFLYFEVPDVFTDERWGQLSSSYPRLDDFESYAEHAVGTKKYVNDRHPGFNAFIEARPAWSQLIEELRSGDLLSRLYDLCVPHLAHRPPWERLRWCLATNPAVGRAATQRGLRVPSAVRHLGRTPVRVGIEFSYLAPGDRIPPHTDVPGKLLSLMLYFPRLGQETEPLGTEYYRGKPGIETWHRWSSSMPGDEETEEFLRDHERFYRTPFRGNTLVGFLKNDVSWHGLAPIPQGTEERRALIVNVFRSLR